MRPGPKGICSDVTLPLRRLTAMNMKFNLTAKCQEDFRELKELISTSTVAMHCDQTRKPGLERI